MKKPVIILTPRCDAMEAPFREVYYNTNGFNMRAIRRSGGFPLMPSFVTGEEAMELMQDADGLFLTGGADIAPSMYGQEKDEHCGPIQPDRDRSDCALLQAALALKKPVLCICRGCQLANAFLGGTLFQDVPTQHPTGTGHAVYDRYDRADAHLVRVVPETPLHRLLGEEEIPVNSLHHQAIRELAPGLTVMARSEDGLVESWCLEREGQWIRAYQWHPEMLAENRRSDLIFEEFISVCQGRKEKK